jgi:hypothetical protein
MVRRAKELNQLEDRMTKARQLHRNRAPVPMNILQDRMNAQEAVQGLSRNVYMETKLPKVLKAFKDVVAMCDTIKKSLEQNICKVTELQNQRSAQGMKEAKWNRDREAVVASMKKLINGVQVDGVQVDGAQRKRSVKSLVEKIEACKQEETAAIGRKDKFKSKCEEMLIPVQDIRNKIEEVTADASAARLAIQALETALQADFLAKLALLEALVFRE